MTIDLEVIVEALKSFGPHAIVCSRPSSEYPSGDRVAWVKLPTDPSRSANICLDGDHEGGSLDPGLTKLLSILDEVHEKLRKGDLAQSC